MWHRSRLSWITKSLPTTESSTSAPPPFTLTQTTCYRHCGFWVCCLALMMKSGTRVCAVCGQTLTTTLQRPALTLLCCTRRYNLCNHLNQLSSTVWQSRHIMITKLFKEHSPSLSTLILAWFMDSSMPQRVRERDILFFSPFSF